MTETTEAIASRVTAGRVVPVGLRATMTLAAVSVVGVAAFLWPLVAHPPSQGGLAHSADAPWLILVIMPLLVAVLVGELTAGRLDAKSIALLGVLTAAGAALRVPTGGVAGLEIVFFLFIPGGRVFGRGFGFVLSPCSPPRSSPVGSVRGCRSRCSRQAGSASAPGVSLGRAVAVRSCCSRAMRCWPRSPTE